MSSPFRKTCPAACSRDRTRAAALGLTALLLAALPSTGGCRPDAPPPGARGQVGGLEARGISPDDLRKNAIWELNHSEEFASGEILQQVIEQLNRWIETEEPLPDWKADPMLAELPQALRELPAVKNLDKLEFPREDALSLQEAVWLRDLSGWARGDTLDELEEARRLFDWTVRNIQLESAPTGPDGRAVQPVRQIPWGILLFGRGTAMDRAWIFILLARQQGIDAAVLALSDPGDPAGGRPRPWAVGVLSKNQLYVFDVALGLPIPAPGDIKLGDDGQLDIHPATLEQLAADDRLLRRLDLDPQHTYPVKASDLEGVVSLLAASPSALSMRMRLLEDHLAGAEKMALTAAPTPQAERLEALDHVAGARLWSLPYASIYAGIQMDGAALMPFQVDRSRSLWKGRVLHLKGKLGGDEGATHYYQAARLPDAQLEAAVAAKRLRPEWKAFFVRAKQDASYWLGLVSFELGNYRAAIDYFLTRTLAASPDGPWTHGAKYNLGRTYEASGKYDQAAQQYEADPHWAGYHGNALRARWLRAAVAGRKQESKKTRDAAQGRP